MGQNQKYVKVDVCPCESEYALEEIIPLTVFKVHFCSIVAILPIFGSNTGPDSRTVLRMSRARWVNQRRLLSLYAIRFRTYSMAMNNS